MLRAVLPHSNERTEAGVRQRGPNEKKDRVKRPQRQSKKGTVKRVKPREG